MLCALCASDTRVTRTVAIPEGLKRDRLCTNGHRYRTIESSIGWELEDARLRNGDGSIGGYFDRELLRNDVVERTFLRVSEERAEEIVAGTIDALRARMRTQGVLEKIERTTKDGTTETVLVMDVVVIRDAVEHYLKENGHHMLHVLYAMDYRARGKRGRPGWARAEDVLAWLGDEYPDLISGHDQVERPTVDRESWTPRATAWTPRLVVKQPSGAESQRETVDFGPKKFLDSVRKAMKGRPHAPQVAQYVTWLVLRPLAGQTVVTTSQLGVGVLNYLRRIDDIAYLRWATIVKNIADIESFHAETRGLVVNPSPHLTFNKIARPIEFEPV
ncbi:hypothetical protein CH260_20445 [Rhodococcus sp. 05-2256-B2]|nr:hypothetical protein CH258_13975 [Rhodococcus sp. 05-2256-B4]OZD92464.1 hypothetical protein CH260_20445 [Rhodococcus sp. 05-2256-B2]OZD99310.1 hypothetical protein CH257_00655 [Rhodococcus sp. 05-2256-B3]OZE02834.1 hypothetical protein CH285_12770 [Rhodococcus sp. 05-2256-B1]